MPFKAFYLDPGGHLQSGLTEEENLAAIASGEGLLWVDISEPSENDGRFLDQVFNFHPLTIEDCLGSLPGKSAWKPPSTTPRLMTLGITFSWYSTA